MEEKKIEITREQLNEATMDLFIKGELKELTHDAPFLLFLGPVISIELWKILSGEKEVNEDGGQEG